ncbi:GNAT family N-acetyltransferase [Urechidicola croceus]|uniref:GNAT family N-acetyltransferase n=1 Tax=Urechidicola croceus TaxID=1850246 RepID=A0A1D8P5M1_9FLAO|nr:GNAT family N-acetyltransferase [Urechidicola croceus]AOW19888.1 GNAT family N-acetyltransferase [Urechidicola croceus]
MDNITIKIISKDDIYDIIPLLKQLNDKTPEDILKNRLLEMVEQNYECAVMYANKTLIGVCGMWFMTRHYIGKSMEIDHVIIDHNYRDLGLGKRFFSWIYNYAKDKGCDASELNAYVQNQKSHKFYFNEGYNIYGFHFLKILRGDKKFY